MAKNKSFSYSFYVYMTEIGLRISIPLVLLVIIGAWLDKTFNTGHLMLFVCIGLSLIASILSIKQVVAKLKDKQDSK